MKEFNMKKWLVESKSGMYSKTILNEYQLENPELLGREIAKAYPELIRYRQSGDTKKFQDAIFKYAGEMLQNAGISLNLVRGLANDQDWAMDLVSATGKELERVDLKEINPASLGAAQDAADAGFNKEEDQYTPAYQDDAEIEESAISAPVNKVVPAETGLNKYLDLVHHHDWFYHFADDPRAWDRGQAEKAEMKALYSALNPAERQKAMDAFTDKYLEMYDPKQFPNAANNVKYLTTDTFKGAI